MFNIKTTTTNYVKAHYSLYNKNITMATIEYVLSLANLSMSESGESPYTKKPNNKQGDSEREMVA